jgi:cysteinyl-tRNA synthetase
VNFSYDAVKAAQNALIRLISLFSDYPGGGSIISAYKERFMSYINNDLNMPKAIALCWDLIKDTEYPDADKRATILDFDKVFGLNLDSAKKVDEESIPAEITALAEARNEARKNKEWEKADALRQEIEGRGFTVRDIGENFELRHI